MRLKQLASWAALAFAVWFIIEQPATAAHIVHNTGVFLSSAAHGLSTFFTSI